MPTPKRALKCAGSETGDAACEKIAPDAHCKIAKALKMSAATTSKLGNRNQNLIVKFRSARFCVRLYVGRKASR